MHKGALVQDWLVDCAGSEKVFTEIAQLFPGDIHTLFCKDDWYEHPQFNQCSIEVSFLDRIPFSHDLYRYLLPFFPLAIERFDLSEYAYILSSSHAVAKNIKKRKDQLHICYCHTPMRYAWDLMPMYLSSIRSSIQKSFARYLLHRLRKWDLDSTHRVDCFIANSKCIADRIQRVYQRDVDAIIHPPVDTQFFTLEHHKENYFITVSRLVPYKRVDLIVEAFRFLPDKQLVVVGDGPQMEYIRSHASANITFMGYQDNKIVKQLMQKARAFVFAANEDFGITPVEAMSCGTPVICYGKGGVLETVIEGKTGVFFKEQNVNALLQGITDFLKIEHELDMAAISHHAQQFSRERFIKQYKQFVETYLMEKL